ncbi:MAG: hypothetical protein C5B51_16365 [Terriglobia bacterium]|nr:MAG: hypothetical protein C5B51_16365 [Terriglobia bacterium]
MAAVLVFGVFAGLSYAQIGPPAPGGNGAGPYCAFQAPPLPIVLAEGVSERVGDIVIVCTAGTPPAAGQAIPQVNITVSFPGFVTSRILGDGGVSEALLLIDEPNSGLTPIVPGFGPAEPFTVCSTPFSGCVAYANSLNVGTGIYEVAVQGSSGPAATTPAPNIYQGVVNSNQVTFFGVPILMPGSGNVVRVFRITNIRINANGISSGLPGEYVPLEVGVSVSNGGVFPIQTQVPIVGFLEPGLTASVTGTAAFGQCASQGNANTAVQAAVLNFGERYGTSFRTRVDPWVQGQNGGQGNAQIQTRAGAFYSDESGLTISSTSAPPATAYPSGVPFGGAVTGLSDFGTRFRAVFNNIPAGVRLFVSLYNVTRDMNNDAITGSANGGVPPAATSTTSFAELVTSETVSDGNTFPAATPSATVVNITSPDGTFVVPVVEITPVSGSSATSVWEVLTTNLDTSETFGFGVFVSYTSNTPATGISTVNLSFAPASTAAYASTGPIPRFSSTSTPQNAFGIVPCGSPAVVSALPASGSGSSQIFTVTASDSAGTASISSISLLINSGLSGSNACWVLFNTFAGTLQLANNAGSGFSPPIIIGKPKSLTNSQCTVSAGAASVSASGNNLVVNIPVSFGFSFGGAKNLFVIANDYGSQSSGWQSTGVWTVPFSGPPSLVSAVPNSGSGFSQTFSVAVADGSGSGAINYVAFLINTGLNGVNGCWVLFNSTANTLQLANDSASGFSAPAIVGDYTTLSNSQCTVDPSIASTSVNGNVLIVNLPLSFARGFAGVKNSFAVATDFGGVSSGWRTTGSWMVPAAGPTIVSGNPYNGAGSSHTFGVTVSVPSTPVTVSFLVNTGIGGANACWVLFNSATNSLQLANDAGSGFSEPVLIGSPSSLSNRQCSVSAGPASVATSGNNLIVAFPVGFSFSFAGTKTLFAYVSDSVNRNSGWVTIGSWIVPSFEPPTVITPLLNSGVGSSHVFSVTASDGNGANAIRSVSLLIGSFPQTSRVCWVSYNHANNTLQLADDSGNFVAAPIVLGTASSISNSQCTVSAASALAVSSGGNLTVTFPLSFPFGWMGGSFVNAMATDADGLNSGWPLQGYWSVPLSGPPTVMSALPFTGSGSSQTFGITVADGAGASAITAVALLLNTGVNGVNGCWVLFNRTANTLQLANDAATGFSAPVTVGAAASVSNSQCSLSAGSASVTSTGTNLTISFPLSFSFAFAGAKSIYAIAFDNTNQNSGWQTVGSWTVPSSGAPAVLSTTPASGSGVFQSFAVTVADGSGPAAISYVSLLVGTGINGANGCWILFTRAANTLQVANDAATGFSAPVNIGTVGNVSNSRCSLSTGSASVTTSGNTLTVTLPLSFSVNFAGLKSIFVLAGDNANRDSGWISTGTWTVPASGPPVVVSSLPAAGSGSAQTFAVTVADGSGPAAISYVSFLVNTGISGTGGCWVLYSRAGNTLQLANDAGSGFSAPIVIGSASSVSNSQCTVSGEAASAGSSGVNLTINIPVSFAFGFGGGKNIFVYAIDTNSQNSGWQSFGSWTVPSLGPPAVLSMLPASGSGSAQTFAVTVADGGGFSAINYISFLINSGLNGANGCWVLYNRAANTLQLANDAATGFSAPMAVGAGSQLSNGQCTLSTATASSAAGGSNVTVRLPLSFAGGFSGPKNVFVLTADNSGQTSGWQAMGSWTAP